MNASKLSSCVEDLKRPDLELNPSDVRGLETHVDACEEFCRGVLVSKDAVSAPMTGLRPRHDAVSSGVVALSKRNEVFTSLPEVRQLGTTAANRSGSLMVERMEIIQRRCARMIVLLTPLYIETTQSETSQWLSVLNTDSTLRSSCGIVLELNETTDRKLICTFQRLTPTLRAEQSAQRTAQGHESATGNIGGQHAR